MPVRGGSSTRSASSSTAVPELSRALQDRAADPFELDPTAAHRWTTIERLRDVDAAHPLAPEFDQLAHPEWLFLAALLVDAVGDRPDAVDDRAPARRPSRPWCSSRAGDRLARRRPRSSPRRRPAVGRIGRGLGARAGLPFRHTGARPGVVRHERRSHRRARPMGIRAAEPATRRRSRSAGPSGPHRPGGAEPRWPPPGASVAAGR